jgi:L-alanine-DL-glutamate epimerase-like enolase superfamily enzyme
MRFANWASRFDARKNFGEHAVRQVAPGDDMPVKLERWSLHFYSLPYRREIVWANAVEKSGTFAMLVIEGDNGARGLAEGTIKSTWSGVSPRSLAATFEDVLMPRLAGIDISAPAAVEKALAGVPENRLAKGMIDSAAWTLHAASLGTPLWRLWGGVPAVDLTWAITRQPPLVMAREAAEVCACHGFGTLKVKGGQGLEIDLWAMREIRAAVGDKVSLYVDANSAYGRDEAAAYVSAIADAGAVVAEDPCPLWPDAAFNALQHGAAVPILVDRNCTSVQDAQAFIEKGGIALSTKPGRIGLTEARAINALAAAHGAKVAVGLYAESALGTLVSLQQASALPAAQTLVAAEQTFFLEMEDQVLGATPAIANGRLTLPESVDLFALVDQEKLARHAL